MNVREMMRAKQAIWNEEKQAVTKAKKEELKTRAEAQESWNNAMEEKRKFLKKKYKGKVFTAKNRPDKKDFLHLNSGEILVETAGFIPLSEQVRRFERAGLNLRAEMEKKYDYSPVDINMDGYKDTAVAQYPDHIEGWEMVQDAKIQALKEKIKAVKDAEEQLRKPEIPVSKNPPADTGNGSGESPPEGNGESST